jgi:uncharacterized protein YndB with AHSA1/START domain
MENQKIKIENYIKAPVHRVWDAYNNPDEITKWNQASEDWHCPKAEVDLNPGGKYKTRMEAKDGSFGFDFEAVYDEIVPQAKVAYTIADGRKVETVFENLDGSTKITTEFEAENQNPVEMQRGGWQSILNNFKNYVENNP